MAYPFVAAEVLTAVDLNAMIGAPTQNTQTGTTYTAVLLDAGKTVTLSNASAVTLTIPAQASVSWADNTQLNFLNLGAGTVTITAGAGVTINGTPLTLTTSQRGSLVRTASNTWTFTPTGGGGKVLQVVRATDTTQRTTTSTSYVDVTGMSISITPQKADSNLLIIMTGYVYASNGTGDARVRFRISDSSNTALSGAESSGFGLSVSPGGFPEAPINVWGWVAAASTAARTYKLRFNVPGGTGYLGGNHNTSQMFAIEIGA